MLLYKQAGGIHGKFFLKRKDTDMSHVSGFLKFVIKSQIETGTERC